MSKKLLVGLGMLAAGASAALVASKKLTADQKDKLAMKVDETVLNGRTQEGNKLLATILGRKWC